MCLSQAFIDNQTLVGMKVMSKDPGKVWCIWRVYLGVINAKKISGLYLFVTELRLKKWKNSNLEWWNFENLKFWFFSCHFFCVWAGPKLLTHNIGPYVGSLSSKKKFFFLDIFREIWKFRQSPDFTRSQIWGLSYVPGSKPSSVLESWQNLLSSKVWVNLLLSTFRPSK